MLPITEAAKKFGVSRPTLDRYIKAGLLKKFKRPLDKRTFVDDRALKRLLEKGLPFKELKY